MGIDHTAWAGYGVTGLIDEPSDLLRQSKVPAVIRAAIDNEGYDLETQMDEWLVGRGITRVTVMVSGNSWTGVERWNLLADGTITSVDETSPLEFLEQPDGEVLRELQRALELLGIEDEPRWMLQLDVH